MTQVGIIGAGPSGLALAKSLDRYEIPYTIYEARRVGATWDAVPADLKVLSPWWSDILSTSGLLLSNPFGKPTSRLFHLHLQAIAKNLRGGIRENFLVTSVAPGEVERWKLNFKDRRPEEHEVVVVATGYFFNPQLPSPMFESDGSINVIHSAFISDYDQLDSAPADLLVIGGRVTAGQLIVEISRRGMNVDLSVRSPLEFSRDPGIVTSIRENIYLLKEELDYRLFGLDRMDSFPGMAGGEAKHLIEEGMVDLKPNVKAISRGMVLFANQEKKRYDQIILATGYCACLGFLLGESNSIAPNMLNGFELKDRKGIYLLGFDNLTNQRSRYLRGIRADAKLLAKNLRDAL